MIKSKDMIVTSKGTKIAVLRMVRTQDGLEIYVKSKILHRLFKSYSDDTVRYNSWSRSSAYNGNCLGAYDHNAFTSDPVFDLVDQDYDAYDPAYQVKYGLALWGANYTVQNPNFENHVGIPNISWLTSTNLNKGVRITIPRPISSRQFELYSELASSTISWIWETFCTDKINECEFIVKKIVRRKAPKIQRREKDNLEGYV